MTGRFAAFTFCGLSLIAASAAAVPFIATHQNEASVHRTHSAAVKACHARFTREAAVESCLERIVYDGDWGVPPGNR
jgi:hypothetical protein